MAETCGWDEGAAGLLLCRAAKRGSREREGRGSSIRQRDAGCGVGIATGEGGDN
jgi:hypothetical protein